MSGKHSKVYKITLEAQQKVMHTAQRTAVVSITVTHSLSKAASSYTEKRQRNSPLAIFLNISKNFSRVSARYSQNVTPHKVSFTSG